MLSKFSIGINFSGTHAYIVCLEKKLSAISVKAHTLIELDTRESDERHIESIEQYLSDFIETNSIIDPEIHIGFPRERSILRELEFPLAVKEDIHSTVQYSLEKYIPLKAEDLYFDCCVISENKQANTLKVILCAAKKEALKPFVDLAVSMEFGVSGVGISSAAAVNYVAHGFDLAKDGGTVFYADENILEISSFDNGVFGRSKYVKLDTDSDIDDLVLSHDQGAGTVFLCGKRLSDALKQRLEDRAGVTVNRVGVEDYDLPSEDFIPALGLALSGVTDPVFNLNLLPESKRKKASKAARYFMYMVVCVAVILGFAWGGSWIMYQRMTHSRLDDALARLSVEVMSVNSKRDDIAAFEKKINTLNTLSSQQIFMVDVLDELSRTIPSGSWVKSISFTMKNGVRIQGFSDAASDLIPLLEQSDRFKNSVFLSAITKGSDGKERFNIGFELR